jgi:hypothetical protein
MPSAALTEPAFSGQVLLLVYGYGTKGGYLEDILPHTVTWGVECGVLGTIERYSIVSVLNNYLKDSELCVGL